MEHSRGLTEYIYEGAGCAGIIKQRFSDFHVNEVDLQGRVVHFDSSCISNKEHAVPAQAEPKQAENKEENAQDLEMEMKNIRTILPENHEPFSGDQVDMLVKIQVEKGSKQYVKLAVGDLNKVERTKVHEFVRKYFSSLESNFLKNAEGAAFIKITRSKKGNSRRRTKEEDKRSQLVYKFVLHKQNIGTMDAVSLMCGKLKLKNHKSFGFAGNKDKRGITVQEMTSPISPQRLMQINSKVNNLRVGNFRVVPQILRLGDLKGNKFTIVIRDVEKEGFDAGAAFKSLGDNGFINYYGMQRFGTRRVATCDVGVKILQSDWTAVVDLILSNAVDNLHDEEVAESVRNWQEEGNAQKCLTKLPFKFTIEKNLLRGIVRCGTKQLVQALDSVPRQTRHLYLHSYQSFVWNRVASMRIKKYGLNVVVGDLVKVRNDRDKTNENGEPALKKAKLQENDENGDAPAEKSPDDYVIRRVTSQEECGEYEVTQVVLPVPGHNVIYPEYPSSDDGDVTENWYEKIVEGDGLKMTSFAHPNKCYSLCGDYRNLISKVGDLSYEFVKYEDYKIPLVLSDVEKLENVKFEEQPQGKYDEKTALVVKFQLNTSSYATVALREICKTDLSAQHQTVLSSDKNKN